MSLLVGMMDNEVAKLSAMARWRKLILSKLKDYQHEGEVVEESRKKAGKAVVLVQAVAESAISDATLSLIMDRFSPS